MATAKKVNKAEQVRAYQAKNPDASAIKVAKACNTNPAYVYAIRASDKKVKPQKWKITDIVTSKDSVLDKLKTMPLTSARKAEIERKVEADRIFELTKGRDRVEMLEPQADNVNHPAHYKVGGIETIDFIEAKGLSYHLGNVVKYIARADSKGNREEDLLKARWYLNREIAKFGK
jgi:hypothetical protein